MSPEPIPQQEERDWEAQLADQEQRMDALLVHITTAAQRIRDHEAQQADEERQWALNRDAEQQREETT